MRRPLTTTILPLRCRSNRAATVRERTFELPDPHCRASSRADASKIPWCVLLLLAHFAASPALADLPECSESVAHRATAPRFDPIDGTDPRRYPPPFPVDFRHLKLELNFDTLADRSFTGSATYTLRAVRPELKHLKLDAVDVYIESVTDGAGNPITFDHDAVHLALQFSTPLPTGEDTTLNIRYRCVDPEEGMYFALPDAAYPDRPLVVHTQGETETSRYWFPCIDSPYDRLTTELVVTVPDPFFALSNGRLLQTTSDPKRRRTTYHWKQGVPQVFYLVTLVIGEFDVVHDTWRDIPVDVYAPKGRADDARRAYGRTARMMDFFSEMTGVDYPYEKYAQVTVPLFRFGGMENTSATTMHDRALLDARAARDTEIDGLVAHELAHQWFGDLITCRSWPHVWLNEGFATFMDTLWFEEHFGREEYLYSFFTRFQSVARTDTTDTPGYLVWDRYETTFEPFFHKGALAYSKGSSLLQMLRHQLGDELFWSALRTYTRRHRETLVETNDLRHVFEEVTGRDFERFFDQWAFQPGTPRLEVKYTWHDKRKIAEVAVRQVQKIDLDTPAFTAPLDLQFRVGGKLINTTMHLSHTTDAFRREFSAKPDMFCVDPNVGLLALIDTSKPRPLWITQLAEGSTNVARIVAARALAKHNRPEVVTALTEALNDDHAHWSVRAEAATALGALKNPDAVNTLIAALHKPVSATEDARTHTRVRRAAVAALGRSDDPRSIVLLLGLAGSDPSYSVEAAATAALGQIPFIADPKLERRVIDTLMANTRKSSHEDVIRVAALSALADRRATEGISAAKECAAYGQHPRTRPTAMAVLARLAQDSGRTTREYHDARDFLIALLDDPQERTVSAALNALATMPDAAARAAIKRRLDAHTTAGIRRTGESVLAKLDEPLPTPAPIERLQSDISAFTDRLKELESRLQVVEQQFPTPKP